MSINVNPTRMEMQKQKLRLKTAKRGHKLLKDKSDEMIRHFMMLVRKNKALREEFDPLIISTLNQFLTSRTQMHAQEIESAASSVATEISITPGTESIMGMPVPKMELHGAKQSATSSHSVIKTTSSFDNAVKRLREIMEQMIYLAEVEKTCDLLALEIARIRRRINALEFILMPQIENTIRFIRMKLAENERSQLVRVMKVKANIEKQDAEEEAKREAIEKEKTRAKAIAAL